MPRTMLQLRIAALSQHLEQAQDPSVWKQTLDLPIFNVDDRLWNIAVEKIHVEAGELCRTLEVLAAKLRDNVITQRDGWRKYARVQMASEEVFRECLDLLGGLALRDRIQEEHICRVADEYIKELSSDTGRRESFAIPGLDARLSSTLRRVAKLQFPEWTVWTLPLVAHEYGHVIIEESGLKKFAEELTNEMACEEIGRSHAKLVEQLDDRNIALTLVVQLLREADPDAAEQLLRSVTGAPEGVVEQLKTIYARQRQRVRILLADALATFLAGPAYAYAALLLRLNPVGVETEGVSDQERAATILAVLRFMNEAPPGSAPPHGNIVDDLKEYWRASVAAARADTVGLAAPELDDPPPVDPQSVRDAFRFHIVGHRLALYEREHSVQALKWSQAWQTELNVGTELTPPAPDENEHIREAINAAWRARVAATSNLEPPQGEEANKRVELLERVALDLCDEIMRRRGESIARTDMGGGTDLGRAQRPRRSGMLGAG